MQWMIPFYIKAASNIMILISYILILNLASSNGVQIRQKNLCIFCHGRTWISLCIEK